MPRPELKELVWVGSSRRDLKELPKEVRRELGIALYFAQRGEKHPSAKPMRGGALAGAIEIVEDHDGNTYRAVYTVKFGDVVYVLHAFQKKSTRGIRTPQKEIDLIAGRLQTARRLHAARLKATKEER